MKNLLSSFVNEEQIKKAGLTANHEVAAQNFYAKGQQTHKSNEYRRIYDENGATEYCIKRDNRSKSGYVIVFRDMF